MAYETIILNIRGRRVHVHTTSRPGDGSESSDRHPTFTITIPPDTLGVVYRNHGDWFCRNGGTHGPFDHMLDAISTLVAA